MLPKFENEAQYLQHVAKNPRHDPRYVRGRDERAVLRAWGGADKNNDTMDMGGWTDADSVDAFIEAVQDDALSNSGERLAFISIFNIYDQLVHTHTEAVEEPWTDPWADTDLSDDDAPTYFTRRQA